MFLPEIYYPSSLSYTILVLIEIRIGQVKEGGGGGLHFHGLSQLVLNVGDQIRVSLNILGCPTHFDHPTFLPNFLPKYLVGLSLIRNIYRFDNRQNYNRYATSIRFSESNSK